eukprot:scaffold6568_cov171-Alexandrium_tamarense.AAC.1
MEVDPRRAQLDLAGSLGEKEAAEFVAELWSLMICRSLAAGRVSWGPTCTSGPGNEGLCEGGG